MEGDVRQASWWRLSIVGRCLLLRRLLHRLGLSLAGRRDREERVKSS